MYKHDKLDYALIFLAALYNLGLLFFTLLWIFSNTFKAYKSTLIQVANLNVNESVTYGLFFSGVLGGAFYCLRTFYQKLGEAYTPIEKSDPQPSKVFNIRTWFFWYLYRPIQGGVLALILLSLVSSNLLVIKQFDSNNIKSYYSLIAIGFLSGFGSHEVIHKIQEIIKVLFAKAATTQSNAATKFKENKNEEDK